MRSLLAALALIVAVPTQAEEPPEQAALAAFDAALRSDQAAHGIPGLQVAIVHGDEMLWSHSYGIADLASGTPVADGTRFVIGSISKLFTAIAIVRLRDAGRLDLDDPVRRHLPWFQLAGDPAPTVTIRELLLQLGGLPREALGASWADRTMPTREALIRDMPSEPEALPPESRWKYSNLGYAILGLVVEAASGRSYADEVAQEILVPLRMADTVVEPAAGQPGLAVGYGVPLEGKREARPFLAMGGLVPAAGIASTARDLARLASWMLSETDGPVLSARSRREMLRPQAVLPDWSGGQGLGFEIRRDGWIGHSGRAGGFASRLEIDPAAGLGVVVLTNADEAGPNRLADRAMALLAPAVAKAAPTLVPDPGWSKYVGTYSFEGRDSAIAIVEGRLAWQDPSAADPAKTRIFLEPAGPDRFRFTSGGLVGEIATFETDASGHVRRMVAGGGYDWKK